MISDINAANLYKKLSDDREHFKRRAEDASELTIPQMYPRGDELETSNITYANPYQSLGARGVNNLANKIILSLFPPATAFFKLGLNQLKKDSAGVSDGDLQNAMYKIEKGIVDEMEVSQLRSVLVDIIKQGIIGGSSLLYIPDEGKPKQYSLNCFCVKRTKSGLVTQIVIKESVNFLELPKDVREELKTNERLTEKEEKGEKDLHIYTMIILKDDKYHSIQEVHGTKIKGTEASYNKIDMPYIFVPFVDRGENYGRSYVEDYIGDLRSYEGLRQAILEASSESARIIYLVKPNGVLQPRKLEKAESGDVLLGSPDDVATLQADKRLDVGMAQQEADVLRTDLSTIFLLDSAVRRNAERVTAEEIRRVSQELEVALGGIYSTLANVLQEPLVHLYLKRLVKKKFMPNILKASVKPEITTGSAALGRGTEFRSIQSFVEIAMQLLGESAGQYMNVPEALNRIAYSLDVNTADLIKTEQEIRQEEEMEQQRALEQNAVAPAINAANQQQLNNNQGN